ncbi:MAG: glucuronate isomerase [Lachnospiraceae bacterium]|jgi:glucuronate isomerase|nr:glucuronate isomerase [Lachnospiraceae bacterium]MCI1424941.1 glucuronate isomerase [Lachnospiraceae bacterium]MCI1453624.1 glucuronate isomerase [Lachnospiraceae bacterium]MDD5850186.1 glucuronate isomerase [Bacillota bacterium]
MKAFMDKDFMLKNETAKHLFHDYAEDMPIIDYHCHIPPKEIYEDRRYDNIAQVWLGGKNPDGSYFGDHYKWRVMRSNGVPEELVTGNADPYDKFLAFTKALEMAIGNPMYHWSNLELHKYFGITEPLTEKNAKAIWDKTSDMLQHDPNLTVRGIIRQSNVKYVGTTDDPADSLEWHEKLAKVKDLGFMVCPSFRPDKAVNIQRPGFAAYMDKLAASVGKEHFASIQEVLDALNARIDFFKAHGCRASDHGLDYVPFRTCSLEEADGIFRKAMKGEALTTEEIEKYQTTVLLSLARKYHKENIVMEIHYSCTRDNNKRMFRLEGPDTGFDMIAKSTCYNQLAELFSALDETGELPKTIVFSLDEADFNQITTCLGCFQSDEIPGKMQLGAAWWFLDTRDGMEAQMKSLANLGLLGNFVGMLTDSRSFLSYTRHDYFRRIACNLIGQWVEDGEYPDDEDSLKKIVQGISYTNAERYFGI